MAGVAPMPSIADFPTQLFGPRRVYLALRAEIPHFAPPKKKYSARALVGMYKIKNSASLRGYTRFDSKENF